MNDGMDARPNSRESREYFELVRFETIGAHPEKLRECLQCATWLRTWLGGIGAETELLLPPGVGAPPVVYGERKGTEGAPTVLVYGHYDVQPPDPLDAWETPPFEPTERNGRVYARGAQDDKGQFFAFLCGLRRWLETAPAETPTIRFVLEGQEESGSGALFALLADPAMRAKLRADVLAVCDTGAAAALRPAIVAGLRGVTHFTLRLFAANRDLHSGEFGGVAPNAAQAMCELLASLHAPDGSIAVAGFCDGIEPPTEAERAAAAAGQLDEAGFAAEIGCPAVGGERALPPVERNSFRPTIEVNGVHSGYGGPGSKTVIPCEALAKLSMRLVPGQDPKKCLEDVRRHLETHLPPGTRIAFEDVSGEARAMRLPLASPIFRLAADLLAEIDPRGAVYQWDGASIPIVAELARVSGAAPLLVGFGQPEDRIHSPNESFGREQFARAMAWAEKLFPAL